MSRNGRKNGKSQKEAQDGDGRAALALARGLQVIGSAGLLVRAKERGLVAAVQAYLRRMRAQGLRFSDRFVRTLLTQMVNAINETHVVTYFANEPAHVAQLREVRGPASLALCAHPQ